MRVEREVWETVGDVFVVIHYPPVSAVAVRGVGGQNPNKKEMAPSITVEYSVYA